MLCHSTGKCEEEHDMIAVREARGEAGATQRSSFPVPPESREERERRLRLRRRVHELGMTIPQAAELLGVKPHNLANLLSLRARTSPQLGYDQWASRLEQALDRYETALEIVREEAATIRATLDGLGLPYPGALVAFLREQKRGGRRAGR
jgi:hypothetical protein